MSDIIFKTNGKEGFRIPPLTLETLTLGTKCPETKLEIKMTEFQPKPQTPEEVAEGLRDAMKQAKEDGVFDLEKFNNRPPSLWNVMRHQLGFSIDMCDEIVDAVEEWMPKEHDTNSYEWNKCVRMLREKLWEQSE